MATIFHRKPFKQQFHDRHFGHSSIERFFGFLFSWISTLLLIGFIWGVGYLMYLLLLNEIS